ncbi:RNA exonuclease 1 homolog [Anoplophora glabripennis]|uniref:RNA exonuclease 1 homolog n=1 Tax=Anoplophora glabripennis TaxID=217634 RepID=UPI000873887E|nr:RNA exonuclease 1 homolog [Anoplophora glabripennis]
MLPTKGYFQDIECPYYNSLCGRPYCHFRHKKKPTENADDVVSECEKEISAIPTYKPTPKSELANIQNSKSHIPISYVPDFTTDRKSRPLPKFDKPTYKPTPLSILSSANKRRISEENGENIEAIKEIKQNIANVEYNPAVSLQPTKDIDFEDLSTEFDLIDEIINSTEKIQKNATETAKNDIEDELLNSNNEEITVKEGKESQSDININENIVKSQQKEDKTKSSKLNIEKLERHEKFSDKKEKYEKNEEKPVKANITKEKDTGKSVKEDKSKRSKNESSAKHEKSEKSRKGKESKEKHRSSERSSSVKEKTSSSKESSSKDKNKTNNDKSHKSVYKDKHRKEEKKGKEEKHSHNKSKHKSRDSSTSRSKEKSSHKSREKERDRRPEKEKKIEKDKYKSKSKHKVKEKSDDKKEKYSYLEESSNESDTQVSIINDIDNNFSDLDFDDEDETMLECYKIFNEYKPPEKPALDLQLENKLLETSLPQQTIDNSDSLFGKKRIAHSNIDNIATYSQLHPPNKPKTVNTPGQMLTNRYKIAKLAQANREQECIINEIKQTPLPAKRPAPSLLEAAREHKLRRQQIQNKREDATCLVDDIIKGVAKPNSAQTKVTIKKIAPAQNVKLIEKAKERISKIKQTSQVKTVAQTQKTGRVAHIPEVSLSDIPDVLQAEKSKLPVNVRTRFLTMIADECVKLYVSRDEAFTRALNEEFSCYEKCKVLATYRNSAMLAVNRLRKEVQERDKLGLGLIGLGETSGKNTSSELRGRSFYDSVKKWILSEDELDTHGYPRESDEHYGRAVIKNRKSVAPSNLDDNQKRCSRCHKNYQVDDDGWPLFEEECLYHPLKKRTIRGEQTYLCCRSSDDMGCATSDTHVSEGSDETELSGFQKTMDPEYEDDPRSYTVYALDCEMCYTTKGLELTRVTIVDTDCKTVYESLVKPLNPIIDYNTRFSGITKEQMDKTSTSILQIQANILHLCNSRTILVGHSLESDMKALKIVHETVIDTSVLFPHKMGLPHKRALKALASEYLRKIIQNDISGHDSAEDAITCMELIKWKLKDETKTRGSK